MNDDVLQNWINDRREYLRAQSGIREEALIYLSLLNELEQDVTE